MTDITIENLTNETSTDEGTGTFDVIMRAINIHLDKQFTKNRIRGPEYASVYLGSMQIAVQQALSFLLTEQEASKKIILLDEQIEQAGESTDLIIAQTSKVYEDIKALQNDTTRKNILNSNQISEIQEKVDLLQSQDLEVIAKTARDDLISAAQVLKINSETTLLGQKLTTELAQTVDATGGIIMAQQALTTMQKNAFKGKHLNDALKLQLDTWATAYAISDGDIPSLPQFMVDANAVSSLPTLDALITESEDFMDNL